MISTLLFANVASAFYCPQFPTMRSCMNYYPTCDWIGQCGTSRNSQCYDQSYNQCLSTGGCSWDIGADKCTSDACGTQACPSDCTVRSTGGQCQWEEYCGSTDLASNKNKKVGALNCARRLEDAEPSEEALVTDELEAPTVGEWLTGLMGFDGTRRAEDAEETAEEEDSAEDAVAGDAETEETEDSQRRRNYSYCSKYNNQQQCNVDSVCSWQTLYGHWNNGECQTKQVTGCQAHSEYNCAGHYGNSNEPCHWVGYNGVGSCVEQTAPAPSPADTCEVHGEYNCAGHHGNNGEPCHWVGYAGVGSCVEQTAPAPSPADTCGMFYSRGACPSNCHWNGSTCVSGSNSCSGYSHFSSCSAQWGCQWSIIYNQCERTGSHNVFCDTMLDATWCNKFSSMGCHWSYQHNQCLAQ